MEFFKSKPAVPVNLDTFRKNIIKQSFVQMVLIAIFLVVIHMKFKDPGVLLYILIALLLVLTLITGYFLNKCDYRGRFKDIYPDYEFKEYLLILFAFFPLIYFPFVIFLCTKNKSDKKPLKMFQKFSSFLIVALPLFVFEIASPKIAYWIANPSTFYGVKVINNAREILVLKENVEKSPFYISSIDQYIQEKHEKLNTTELILVTAVTTTNIIKKKQIDKSLKAIENNVKYSILVLEEMNKIIAASENSKFEFFDYSLVHWLSPGGVVEIILITGFEMDILQKFKLSMIDKKMGYLQNLENGMDRLPDDVQALYLPLILKINLN
jgi:hypothetical protein